ncbi:MAG: NAD-binding protein [Planctomycetota bacterium]
MKNYGRSFTAIIGCLLIFGTCGYVLIEGWTVFDGLYMTVITLSTVGYGETQELSNSGRMFTAMLIGVSVVSMACWTAGITSVLVSGDLSGAFRKKKERKMIAKMKGHTVVCGGGVLARTVIDQLVRDDKELVCITNSKEDIDLLRRFHLDLPIIENDPKSELAMADANALAANYLIAAAESDYDNLLITITGRSLGTRIKVISCAQGNELASRMLKVGADEVICPLVLGGEHAAKMVA